MKTLELNQMELVDGGNGCSNVENGINAGGIITVAITATFVTTTLGLGLLIAGAFWVAAGYVNCEMK